MTRDIVDSNKIYDVETTVTNNLNGNVTSSVVQSSARSRFAYRDDAISTDDFGGYHSPTPYNAFRYGIDVSESLSSDHLVWGIRNPCSNISVDKLTEVINNTPQFTLGYYGTTTLSQYKIVPNPPGYLESRVLSDLQRLVQQQGWAISQSAGEMPETVKLLLSASKRLLTSVKLVKQGRLLKALLNLGVDEKRAKRSLLGKAANLQLEFQYGWKPLMSEIHSLATAVEDGLNQPISKPITVRQELDFTLSEEFSDGDYKPFVRTGHGRYVVKAGIKAHVTNDTLAQLGSHGLLNPAALAWELFPVSFVIDWFVPIGDFLGGLSTHFGMEFRDGYMTKYVEWSSTLTGTVVDPTLHCSNGAYDFHRVAGIGGNLYGQSYGHTEWLECFERQLMPFPPPPVPYWDPQLNLSKVSSILTLLTALVTE